jgi:hypothetical protein
LREKAPSRLVRKYPLPLAASVMAAKAALHWLDQLLAKPLPCTGNQFIVISLLELAQAFDIRRRAIPQPAVELGLVLELLAP